MACQYPHEAHPAIIATPPVEATGRRAALEGRSGSYHVHDNGGRPFLVHVTVNTAASNREPRVAADGAPLVEGHVAICPQRGFDEVSRTRIYDARPRLETASSQIFVGVSPQNRMTLFSGGHGPRFDGNTILFRVPVRDGNLYVHVGRTIVKFQTAAPIVKFLSPVGNNDVPYPYAIDELGNVYLITESVVLSPVAGLAAGEDPYDYYYNMNNITWNEGHIPRKAPADPDFEREHEIVSFWCGGEPFTLKFSATPEADYDRLCERFGPVRVRRTRQRHREPLTKGQYVLLMRAYGARHGFTHVPCWTLTDGRRHHTADTFRRERHWTAATG